MADRTISQESKLGERWTFGCGKVQKEQVTYFCQIIIVYTVIVVCLINLWINGAENSLWVGLLSGSVGYVLPAPKIRKKKRDGTLLPDSTQQQLV